ncbi:RDD family protein [Methylomagnum sp.]
MPPPIPPAPAGLLRRLAAMLYDALLLAGVLFAATLVILPLRGGEAFRAHDPIFSVYLLGVAFLFLGWFWTHGGQTLGMRAWRIRLQSSDGGPASWRQATVRYLFALISGACLGLGFLWIALDPHKRGWHDLASGTRIVRL